MTSFKLNKKSSVAIEAWIYAFIQVGSVHLAWHYAVDGYVGALMVAFFKYLIGYMLRKELIINQQQQ